MTNDLRTIIHYMKFKHVREITGLHRYMSDVPNMSIALDLPMNIEVLVSREFPDGNTRSDQSNVFCACTTEGELGYNESATTLHRVMNASLAGPYVNFQGIPTDMREYISSDGILWLDVSGARSISISQLPGPTKIQSTLGSDIAKLLETSKEEPLSH